MRERLLGGLSPRTFLRRHWQKRPLMVRGALPGFRGPLGERALAARDDFESEEEILAGPGDLRYLTPGRAHDGVLHLEHAV